MEVILFIGLGVWVAFAVLAGWIATQKNRAIEEGVILGLLFGPFGTLVEALLPSMTKEERERINFAKKVKREMKAVAEKVKHPKRVRPAREARPKRIAGIERLPKPLLGEISEE